VADHVAGLRRLGTASLDLAWVAAGRQDGFWEYGLKPWDIAAGILLVREAGGRVGRLEGDDDLLAEGTLVAATGGLFPKLTELLQAAG
jgi:myo-inositol-1(or 4)-monophosphatase